MVSCTCVCVSTGNKLGKKLRLLVKISTDVIVLEVTTPPYFLVPYHSNNKITSARISEIEETMASIN
jgi:hypothetical protein